MRILLSFICCSLGLLLTAQGSVLQSGPMIGYVDMREALIWVQTTRPAEVQIHYQELGGDGEKMHTATVTTESATAYVAKVVADQVQPGKTYSYQLWIDGEEVARPYPTYFHTQPLWSWRSDPPDFTIAMGSCVYVNEAAYDRPGEPYGSSYDIFEAIDRAQPDLMLWLGDNVYLREADWWTRRGMQHRYTHTRSLSTMQALLARTPNYAIWDDHDYGPNNSDRSWINKEMAKETFDLFWGNPSSGLPQVGGITTMFRYIDADFFLLDNRYFRTPNDRKIGQATILGKDQLEWIIDALVFSNASFKFVCIGGQMLNTAARYENHINLAPEERAYLLQRIDEEDIKNVIFLSGDRHHSEMSRLELPGGNMVYELTASSLTSGTGKNRDEVNENRIDGTLVVQHNFGTIHISGPRQARRLQFRIHDKDGRPIWTQQVNAQ